MAVKTTFRNLIREETHTEIKPFNMFLILRLCRFLESLAIWTSPALVNVEKNKNGVIIEPPCQAVGSS